jgi:hypothetical protein
MWASTHFPMPSPYYPGPSPYGVPTPMMGYAMPFTPVPMATARQFSLDRGNIHPHADLVQASHYH